MLAVSSLPEVLKENQLQASLLAFGGPQAAILRSPFHRLVTASFTPPLPLSPSSVLSHTDVGHWTWGSP